MRETEREGERDGDRETERERRRERERETEKKRCGGQKERGGVEEKGAVCQSDLKPEEGEGRCVWRAGVGGGQEATGREHGEGGGGAGG